MRVLVACEYSGRVRDAFLRAGHEAMSCDFLPTEQAEALDFVRYLMAAPIQRIAIENPISIISTRIRKPDQIIQPWQYGHGETKAT